MLVVIIIVQVIIEQEPFKPVAIIFIVQLLIH